MNKIYKVVWNTVRNCYVVGSELISSKSGRHSTSNGKSSSLKVTLTVLALCGMTALGSGVAPAYAADGTGAVTTKNQYVALLFKSYRDGDQFAKWDGNQRYTTFNQVRYNLVTTNVTDRDGQPIRYWVRDGYSLTMVDGQPYTSLSSNGRRADVSWTGDANAKPSDILESVTSTHVQTNVTTNVGETLQQVNAGTYAGVSNSGGTEVDGSWDYIVKDSSWKGIVSDSNYSNGYADLISNGKPRGFVRTTDAGSKLAWNATLSAYTYNGKVVDYSNIYVIDGEIGVFTNASGSEVYTGTVFGKNNEVLMTVKKSDGSYYSYWGAEVNDAGATMDTYRVAEYQKDLNVLRDNDFALYHNDIKSVDMSTDTSSATISLMRNGDGTTSPAVDGTLTITNGGGTDGHDTYVRISNTTNGQEISKTFSTGSKVSAIGTTGATTGLTINGVDYTIKAGKDYKAGANIQISPDNTISATDTKYTEGENINIDGNNVISAIDTDTKYTAGKNITIDENNVISAKEYTAGTNVSIENNKISAKNTTLTNGPAEKSVNATSGGVTYTIKDTDGNAVTLEDVASATTVNKLIDGAKVHYFSVNASANQGNYNNDGAGNLSIAIGANTSATKEATAVGNKSTADERSAAFGYSSDARGTRAVAIGTEASTNGTNSTAIGQKAVAGYYKSDDDQVQAESATAVGSQAEVLANYGTAVGESAKVDSENGTALGMGAQIWGNSAKGVAIGRSASVGGNGHSAAYGIALGAESQAEAENGIAIGYDAVVSQPNSVALGSHATTNPVVQTSSITIPNTNTTYNVNGTNPVGTVSVGSATGLRTITNVAAGRVSKTSTDAVNGSELYAVATEAAKHTTITTEEGSRITVDSQSNSAGGTEYILDVDTSDLANYSLTNLSQKGKTVITNLAKGVERHIKPDTYAVDKNGSVTMTYVDGNGTPVTGEAKITGIAKSDLSNITKEGNTVINNIAKNAVKVINGKNTTVTTDTDGDATTYAVNVDTSGKIEQNNTHIVTGDTVYKALQNVSWTANVNGQAAKTVKKDGTLNFIDSANIAITSTADGDIQISTKGLASSGDLWTAQAGGKNVKAVDQKVNFNSTDKHLVVESTKDGEITFATKDLADTSFTNITEEGNTYIKNLAKGEDVHIKAKEYAVNDDGSVTMTYVDGNGNTVDGTAKITGIAKSDLSNITEEGDTYITKVANKAVKVIDGKNTTVTPGEDGDVTTYAVNVDTSGKVEQNNTHIVTGDTVYNALQNVSWTANVNGQAAKTVKKDGTLNFIDSANIAITSTADGDIQISTKGLASTGDLWTAQAGGKDVKAVDQKVNFNSTDKHLVVESAQDGEITFATKDLADTSFTNITEEGNTYIKKLAKGEDRHIEAKEYAVSDDGSVTMTYVDGNGNPVTGEAKITGIAKSDLSNITNEGNTVINNIAKNAVKVVDGKNTTVTPGTDGDVTTYAVNVDTSGKIEQNNTHIVTGDTVYNALQNVSWTAKVNGTDAKTVAKDGTLNFVNGDNIAITSTDNGDIQISTTGLASTGDLWTAQAGGKDVKAVDQKVNFNSTDKHLVVESAQDGEITFATKDLADTSFTNITEEGNTYIKKLAKGEDVHIEAKEYAVSDDGSVTMTYVDGNGNAVDGTAKITGIAKSDLSNITNEGNTVINNIAKEAVKVVKGTNTTVTEGISEDGKTKTYAVNVDNAAIQAATDVTGEKGISVTSAVENGVKKYTVSAKLSNNFAIDEAAGNIDLAPSITVGKTNPVTINGNKGEITGLTNKTLDVEGFATKGRAATEEQLKAVDSKATAAKTTVTAGKNIEVKGQSDENGSAYTVGLTDDVSLGNGAIQLNGSDGSISATSGTSSLNFNDKGLSLSNGKNSTVINGGTITVNGGESVISGTQATFGKIKLNAESGSTITGLTNTTTKYDGFATAGRAATEEQLSEVAGKASEAIETAGKGWNLTTNKGTATNIAPDGTVDFSSGNDNLVISNAGADLSFSLSDNLDLTHNKDKKGSVKVGENTALTDELLQVGKDVSLSASALNVGNSSLTTSALMVGGFTYISSSGINANGHRITGVATGVNPTDAVNVSQLESAISGSQVSIKAGEGIIVEKTGNEYKIKTNIEGLSNEHGTVHVSTDSDSSVVTKSDSTASGTVTPKRSRLFGTMLLAAEIGTTAANTTTTEEGKKLYIKYSAETETINTNDGTITLNDGEAINIHGDDKNITTTVGKKTDDNNKEYDTISVKLNDDIKVQNVTSDKVTINNGPTIDSSGINMNNQKITNLADGEIAEGSKDAVNGGQLYNTNQAVIANAENINSLSHSLNKLDSRINRVGAGAAALAALHPLDFDPDNKWDFAAGYGNYAGANAVAIGTYYRPNENTMFSIGGSFGGGENMINAGVSFKLGSGGSGITTSKTVMAKKIKEQDELLKAQDAKMKEQDEKIAKLEALVAQQGEMIQQALGKK